MVLSGPSGAGKSTLLKKLFEEHDSIFGFSVSRECPRTLKGKELRGYPSTGLLEFQIYTPSLGDALLTPSTPLPSPFPGPSSRVSILAPVTS